MGTHDVTNEDKLKSFLYTNSYHNIYITGNPEKHFGKLSDGLLFQWVKSSPEDFFKVLKSANEDPLLARRANIFYILAEAFFDGTMPPNIKSEIKANILDYVKHDVEFFDFVKYFTIRRTGKQKISNSLKKLISKFYQQKLPLEFAKCVVNQDSYHGWTHKDLIKLCHFKCNHVASEPIVKYVLFGMEKVPTPENPSAKVIFDLLKKSHELRTTEDADAASKLIKELHADVDRTNSKLNNNKQVWLAAVSEMTTREVLQSLYRLYKLEFLKSGNPFQPLIVEALSNEEKIKKCNLHPLEVFIYWKFFEKGGKTMDPKLVEYLQKKEIKEDTLKRLMTPSEPKCKTIVQHIGRCLTLSYANVQPTGKRFMVTIDVTEKVEENCFHNKRIGCLEATHAFVRFLCRVEKSVTVAVFKDNKVNLIDLSKSYSAVEKLLEHKSVYIIPSSPIDWARSKKKPVDVFINFMSCNWNSAVPEEMKEKLEKLPEALNKYTKKMELPDTRLVKIYLGGVPLGSLDSPKNILTIAGFSVDVPRVLEAFCRRRFS